MKTKDLKKVNSNKKKWGKVLLSVALCSTIFCGGLFLTGCTAGKDGKDGKDGLDGRDGITWYSGKNTPTYSEYPAKFGDFYLDEDDFIVYKYTQDGWVEQGELKGEQGIQGEPGEKGESGQSPTVEINSEGYWVINGTVTNVKAEGSSGQNGENGQSGKDGATWLTGNTVPSNSLGNDGDLYFNTESQDVYQKVDGAWGSPIANTKGDKGDQGTAGTNGVSITNITTTYEIDSLTNREYMIFTFEFSEGEPKVIRVDIPDRVTSLELVENTFTECEAGNEPNLQLNVVYGSGKVETIDVSNDMFIVNDTYVLPNFIKDGTYPVKISYKNAFCISDIIVKNPTTTIDVTNPAGTNTLEIVDNIDDMKYKAAMTINSDGLSLDALKGRSCSATTLLKVNGGETLTINQYIEGKTIDFSVSEYTGLPISATTITKTGLTANAWVKSVKGWDELVLQSDTRYILICFKLGDGSVDFTEAEAEVLSHCLNISNTRDTELKTALQNRGINNVSILGDSISTFDGVSNNAENNSTTASNAVYYGGSGNTGSSIITNVNDTWWMQAINDLSLKLLVNNSYSGDKCVEKGLNRCVQLHDDNGENAGTNPDLIAVALGINDYNWKTVTVEIFAETYDAMISAMVEKYTSADIFLFTLFPNGRRNDIAEIEKFNDVIRSVASKYNVDLVDIYAKSGITLTTYQNYTDGDGAVHPNTAGMDLITKCFKKAMYEKYVVNA